MKMNRTVEASATVELTALEKVRAEKIVKERAKAAEEQALLEASIPKPIGYHLLIALPNVDETFGDSGLLKAEKTLRDEYILSMIGLVLDMGDQAYADKDRYPTGPWCARGDYVMFRANTGTRFKIGKQEYRIMNDDSVQAVVPNPKAISRI